MTNPTPGATMDLPSEDLIDAAEASLESDVADVFDLGGPDAPVVEAGGTNPPPADAAASGAGKDGSSPAPVTPPEGTTPPTSGAATGQPPAPANGTEASGGAAAAAGTTPAAATPPPGSEPGAAASATPAPDETALRLHSQEATINALQEELTRLRANPQGQPAPAAAQPAPAGTAAESGDAADLPRYNLTLPEPVAAAIMSDDPQKQLAGISHMMNSLATIVHHNVRQETRAAIGGLVEAARTQQASEATNAGVEAGRQDYYKAFPDHQNPLVLPLIQAEAQQMAAELPNLPWSQDYINALGVRVNNRIAALTGKQPAAQPAGQTPPTQPAAMLPTGARTEVPGSELTGGALIADTFS